MRPRPRFGPLRLFAVVCMLAAAWSLFLAAAWALLELAGILAHATTTDADTAGAAGGAVLGAFVGRWGARRWL